MKSFCKIIATFVAVCFATAAAFAADPSGTWKWSQPGRNGAAGFEVTLKLAVKDGALSGTLLGADTPNGKIPDVAIGDASVKDDTVAFSVTREMNGNKRTSKYEGKLEGDTIKGSVERPNRDGAVQKSDWTATRAK
jgi:hypothetical protein